MASKTPPRSKLAIAFYVLGALMILGMLPSAFGLLAVKMGLVGMTAFFEPVAVILFGGVVQILSDIRWHLSAKIGADNA